jgi:hypothetical protein
MIASRTRAFGIIVILAQSEFNLVGSPLYGVACHHRKSIDLSITSSAHSSSTKHLGSMSKKPARISSSSSQNIAPIVIRSYF